MKSTLLSLLILAGAVSTHADTLCTVINAAKSGAQVIVKPLGSANVIVKKDGSILKDVAYVDAVYEKPSSKLGDVEQAVLISINGHQVGFDGVDITMAILSNDQKTAQFTFDATSTGAYTSISNRLNGIRVSCETIK